MAGQTGESQFNPFLSTTQQDLLLAALATNNYNKNNPVIKRSDSDLSVQKPFTGSPKYIDGNMFDSNPVNSAISSIDFEDTSPYLEYLDGDTSFNFDSNDLGGQDMFGSVPGPMTESSGSEKGDKPDKRKNSEDPEEDGDAKRREGEDKTAKKPGRKPLTSEPTTKRKAQNRAAQRAFRERKEKHLKDLETKVESLSKAQQADKAENGVLRAQVERLQAELREYKKRMSMNSAGMGHSPPSAQRFASRSNSNNNNNNNTSDFQFDFPRFGALPGSQLFDAAPKRKSMTSSANSVLPPTHPSRQSSLVRSPQSLSQNSSSVHSPASANDMSVRSGDNTSTNAVSMDAFNSTLPQMSSTDTSYANLFSPSALGTGADLGFAANPSTQPVDNGADSNSGIARVFRFNSRSTSSNTASPSASSQSQFNANSSCGTSPEPNNDSPPSGVPKQNSNVNTQSFTSNKANTSGFSNLNTTINDQFNFDWLASQNGGQFDPVLFGDYRDSQDAIVGDGDFNNGFFNDAFPYDFGSPLNFNLNSPKQQQQQTPQQTSSASRNLLAEVEKAREGNDDDNLPLMPERQTAAQQLAKQKDISLPQAEKMLNCNTIWSQLQNNRDFQDGKFDLDGLCAELRAKAKCSESGVTVPSEYVDAAFKKLSGKQDPEKDKVDAKASYYPYNRGIEYLFQRDSVDEALNKLTGGGQ